MQITEDGRVISRDKLLADVARTPPHVAKYAITGRHVTITGDTATIDAIYTEVGRGRKGYYKLVYRIADVYVYRNGWLGLVGYGHLMSLKRGLPKLPTL